MIAVAVHLNEDHGKPFTYKDTTEVIQKPCRGKPPLGPTPWVLQKKNYYSMYSCVFQSVQETEVNKANTEQ